MNCYISDLFCPFRIFFCHTKGLVKGNNSYINFIYICIYIPVYIYIYIYIYIDVYSISFSPNLVDEYLFLV